MNTNQVKHKLNNIGYNKTFTVIFTKKDGTQRKITGYMERPEGEPKQSVAVPIVTEEGWKSFRLDSVLEIVEAE